MSKKILVVDDEKSIVDILKLNLQNDGYTVYEAYDGETKTKAEKAEEILQECKDYERRIIDEE